MVNFLTGSKKHKPSTLLKSSLVKHITLLDSKKEQQPNAATEVVKKKKKKGVDGNEFESTVQSTRLSASTSSVIDDIFASASSKKMEAVEQNNTIPKKKHPRIPDAVTTAPLQHGVIASAYGTIISPDPPVHRIDKETGLKVYKYAALKVGDGGGTPLCPFDCDCCF